MKPLSCIIVMITIVCLCCSCKKKTIHIERAFYYWKSGTAGIRTGEDSIIKNQQLNKLYIKFFEVAPDPVFGTAPIAKTNLYIYDPSYEQDSILKKVLFNIEYISTVFIQNKIFHNSTEPALDSLADNIVFLIEKQFNRNLDYAIKRFNEIQIDCDWTKNTKDRYFYLLRAIKKRSNKTLSCTLRLYPFKYSHIMGVPPVDKVTLMCYNLVKPLDNDNKNSILDNIELEAYLQHSKKYPLHMDIALPVFSWMQVYQNNEFAGIINPGPGNWDDAIRHIKPLWYEVEKDTVIDDIFLRETDKLKLEDVNEKTIYKTIELLKQYVDLDDTTTVALFHLDKKNLKAYDNETLTKFYTQFGN